MQEVQDAGDTGLIPRSGRSLGGGNGNPLHILAWKFQAQRSLEGYSPGVSKESDMTVCTNARKEAKGLYPDTDEKSKMQKTDGEIYHVLDWKNQY